MVKEGYKSTDIGVVPEEWDLLKIGDFTSSTAGGTPSTQIPAYWNGDIKWMSSGELNNHRIYDVEGRITELGLASSSTHMIPPDCVLIGLAGQGKTRGTVAINYVELCTNQSIAAILPSKKHSSDYLYHNLSNRYQELREMSSGEGGRGGLNLTIINNIVIPMPSLPEQEAIASALSDVDELITNLEKLIEKKKNIKHGVMQELLTGKRRLSGFTGEWTEMVIGKNGYLQKGSINPMLQPEDYFSEYSMPAFDETRSPAKVQGKTMHSNRTVISGRVLLFNKLNVRQKRIWLVDKCEENAVCSGEFLPYCSDSIDLRLLAQILYTDEVTADFIGMSTGTSNSQKRITPKAFLDYSLYLPTDMEEQKALADIFDDMDQEISTLQRQVDKYRQLKQGMMQKLLTGEIRLI